MIAAAPESVKMCYANGMKLGTSVSVANGTDVNGWSGSETPQTLALPVTRYERVVSVELDQSMFFRDLKYSLAAYDVRPAAAGIGRVYRLQLERQSLRPRPESNF
jgi:hypothetical protein